MQPIIDLLQFVFFGFYFSIWTGNYYFGLALPLLAQIGFQWLIGPAANVDFSLTAAYPAILSLLGSFLGYFFLRALYLPRPLRRSWCYLVDWIKAFVLWAFLVLAHVPLQLWPLPIYPYGWLLTWAGTQILIFVWLLFAAGKDEFFELDRDRKVFFWNWFFIQIFMMASLGISYLGSVDKFFVAVICAAVGFFYLLCVILISTCKLSKRANCANSTLAYKKQRYSSRKPCNDYSSNVHPCSNPCHPRRSCCAINFSP